MINRASLLWISAGFLVLAACGSSVSAPGSGPGGTSAGGNGTGGTTVTSSSSSSTVDPGCYEDCLKKGKPANYCADYCSGGSSTSSSGKGGSTTSSSGTGSTGSSGSSSGTGSTGTTSTTTTFDPGQEKTCMQCWNDQAAGQCSAQYKACQNSLACTQLSTCPFACKGTPECFAECNKIIPTGVAPLTALVQCIACNNGPCSVECQSSILLAYCN